MMLLIEYDYERQTCAEVLTGRKNYKHTCAEVLIPSYALPNEYEFNIIFYNMHISFIQSQL